VGPVSVFQTSVKIEGIDREITLFGDVHSYIKKDEYGYPEYDSSRKVIRSRIESCNPVSDDIQNKIKKLQKLFHRLQDRKRKENHRRRS